MTKTLILCTLCTLCVSTSSAQNYRLAAIVFDQGGQRMSSADYLCGLSIGQHVASPTIAGGQYFAVLGFWHTPYAPVGVKEHGVTSQGGLYFVLSGCRPNPFRDITTVSYSLPAASDVTLDIMNTAGCVVTTLFDGKQKSGRYQVSWDVAGVPSSRLPGGIYFARLQAGEFTATKKLVKLE